MRALFFLFVVMPILEMVVLIKVGGIIGALSTVALVFLTATVGWALLKRQGPGTLMRAQNKMQSGQIPAKEMVEGVFLAVGGALLLTPGFITDTIGFCCLIPGVRHLIIAWGLKHIRFSNMQFHQSGGFSQDSGNGSSFQSHFERHSTDQNSRMSESNKSAGDTIDGEFRREDKD